MDIKKNILARAKNVFLSLPIPKNWKNKYLAPTIFRLSGRYFLSSGEYHRWINERNRPLFDRLAGQYCQKWVDNSQISSSSTILTPVVSIIVLSHLNFEYTFACLQSVLENTKSPSFELLLLDNGSKKEDLLALREYVGPARLIRSEENLGYSKGCNLVVKQACGKYLVFLNNDAIVTEGWLETLIQALNSLPEAGIVSPKIVYADGTLQEAGADVLPDGRVVQRGKADDPNLASYNRTEPVQYCSGVAMLVKKDLFEKVGGFDEGYSPAYYEDVDLCFKIREAGYKTYYCPDATVIHREWGTSHDLWGRDHVKDLIEKNRKRFLVKWQDEL